MVHIGVISLLNRVNFILKNRIEWHEIKRRTFYLTGGYI